MLLQQSSGHPEPLQNSSSGQALECRTAEGQRSVRLAILIRMWRHAGEARATDEGEFMK